MDNEPTFERWGGSGPLRITVRPLGVSPPPQSPERNSAEPTFERWGGPMGTGEDVAKSIGSGLVKGTAGLIGLPNAVADIGARGIDAVAQTVGGWLGEGVEPYAPKTSGVRL